MFWVSLAMAIISASWRTLRATNSAVEEAQKDTVEVTREIGNRQIRAYLGIEDIIFNAKIELIGGELQSLRLCLLKNFGQTPTYGLA